MCRRICVYCSSSDRIDPSYLEVADELGALIGSRGQTVIFGGGRVGLMGRVARSTQEAGGQVVGVIPEAMTSVEIAYREADELVVTRTMRERKDEMDQRADAFVVLPGGFGTLEELSEIITHRYLGYHHKPIVLLNSRGFWDKLLGLFDHFIAEGFAKQRYAEAYQVAETPAAALQVIDETLAAV